MVLSVVKVQEVPLKLPPVTLALHVIVPVGVDGALVGSVTVPVSVVEVPRESDAILGDMVVAGCVRSTCPPVIAPAIVRVEYGIGDK